MRPAISASLNVLLCLSLCGCGSNAAPEGGAAASGQALGEGFRYPAYRDQTLASLEDRLTDDLEQAEDAIDQLQREFERIPRRERYRISAGKDALTEAQVIADYLQYRMRELEAYREKTGDTGAARKSGERFLEAYIRAAAGQTDAMTHEQLSVLGDQALEAGSNDPLIRSYVARTRMNFEMNRDLYDAIAESAPQLAEAGYPALSELLARQWLAKLSVQVQQPPPDIEARRYAAIDSAVRFLQVEADAPNLQFVWWQLYPLFESLDLDHKEDFLAACLSADGIPVWYLHMLAGWYYNDLAWKYRGEGFASTVTEEGWRKFHEYLPRAALHYTRAWQLHPEFPGAAAALIWISNAGGDPRWSPRDWFQQSIRAQFDYPTAYDNYSGSLWPRWGGSHPAMLAFAEECLGTDRWDTEVPGWVINTLCKIHNEVGNDPPFGKYPGVANIVEQYVSGLRAARTKYEHVPADLPGGWAYAAGLLVQAGRYQAARDAFEDAGDAVRQHDFNGARSKLTYARGLACAMTGPAAPVVTELEERFETMTEDPPPAWFDEMSSLLLEARKTDTQEWSQPYYRDVEAMIRALAQYHAGEWVDLPFDEYLSGWYVVAEEVDVLEDGGVRLAASPAYHGVQAAPLARFRPPYVIESEIAQWPEKQNGYSVGVIFGRANTGEIYSPQMMRGVILNQNGTVVHVIDETNVGQNPNEGWLFNQKFHVLRLNVWDRHVGFYANHHRLRVTDMEEGLLSSQFHIGELFPADKVTAMQIRKVRIRKLTYGPPPSSDEPSLWNEFLTHELEFDPDNVSALVQFGADHYRSGDYEGALELLERGAKLTNMDRWVEYFLGATYLAMHRFRDSIPHYELAIRRNPQLMEANSNLAWVLAAAPDDALRDGHRALVLAHRACELKDYKHWQPLCALAAAHAELGQYDEAAKWIEQSVTLGPDSQKAWLEEQRATIARHEPLRIMSSAGDVERVLDR